MRLDDFERLDPDEFQEVYTCWLQSHAQEDWERARFVACCALQPYSKKALKATDVCRFPWDRGSTDGETPVMSTRERFEELVRRAGNADRSAIGTSRTLSDRK